MPSIRRRSAMPARIWVALPILVLLLVLPFCASEKKSSWEATSLDQAKSLAAQRHSVILVEFWKRH